LSIWGILAVDLDGTVVRRGLEIRRSDREALQEALRQGLMPVVATGRRPATSRRFAHDLGLSLSPLISCDGALVMGPGGEEWAAREVPRDVVRTAARLCEEHRVGVAFSTKERLYVQPGAVHLHPWRHIWRRGALRSPGKLRRALWDIVERTVVQGRFDADAAPPVYKIDLFGPGAADARPWLLPAVQGVQETAPVGALEIVVQGVDKSSGIEVLLDHYGLSWQDVIAIGNDWNDARMIERSGFGVAMGDAPEAVRERAVYVTGSIREGGVAAAVEQYLEDRLRRVRDRL
jgi:hydroxymethylpyrimidine pyrophosphatase-like HAD family hydrolase